MRSTLYGLRIRMRLATSMLHCPLYCGVTLPLWSNQYSWCSPVLATMLRCCCSKFPDLRGNWQRVDLQNLKSLTIDSENGFFPYNSNYTSGGFDCAFSGQVQACCTGLICRISVSFRHLPECSWVLTMTFSVTFILSLGTEWLPVRLELHQRFITKRK